MDQGTVSTTGAHYLRLMLIFFGAVLGFLALSLVFGSSSASADDGADSPGALGSALGGIVSTVTEPVSETVATVTDTPTAPAAAPVAELAAPVVELLPPVLQPVVAPVLAPVTTLVDTTLTQVDTAILPVIGPIVSALDTVAIPAVSMPQAVAAASGAHAIAGTAVVVGAATGAIDLLTGTAGPADAGSSGTATGSGGLIAAAAGIGFLALLLMRRRIFGDRAMPGSPVYDTDSSPD